MEFGIYATNMNSTTFVSKKTSFNKESLITRGVQILINLSGKFEKKGVDAQFCGAKNLLQEDDSKLVDLLSQQ
jgi:hypothetical protein